MFYAVEVTGETACISNSNTGISHWIDCMMKCDKLCVYACVRIGHLLIYLWTFKKPMKWYLTLDTLYAGWFLFVGISLAKTTFSLYCYTSHINFIDLRFCNPWTCILISVAICMFLCLSVHTFWSILWWFFFFMKSYIIENFTNIKICNNCIGVSRL